MDSVSAPVERQPVGVLTMLAALVLVAFLALMAWLQYGGSRLEAVAEPERALALIVGRTMDLDEAVARAPAWERFVYRLMATERAEDLAEAIAWYDALAGASLDPTVDLHLAILEGEAGRLDGVRRRTEEWDRRPDPLPAFARVVAGAYLGDAADGEVTTALDEVLEDALVPGWFRDRIATRLASRVGDPELLSAATAAQSARSGRLLIILRVLLALELVLLALGLRVLVRLARRRAVLARIGAAVLPPPWRGREGVVVLVWGGALGALTLGAFHLSYLHSSVGPDRPLAHGMIGAATNLAFVPVIILARVRLLRPSGLRFGEGFALAPAGVGARRLAAVVLTLLAIGQLGGVAVDMAGRWLGLSAHWTEWFDPDLVWAEPLVVGMTLVDTVLLTPVFEELVFRGLLFATLRRRFGLSVAAVLSAAIFAVAHGYGGLGFAAVFWSGFLWAWAYERTGSLLPPIAAHAADNLVASLSVILVLRG